MACDLITGTTLDCRDNLGGVKSIFIGSTTAKEFTITQTDGVATALTAGTITINSVAGLTTADMFEFQQPRQVATLSEAGAFSEENGTAFYTQTATMVINKMDGAKLNNLNLLGKNTNLVVVIQDSNDLYWILGNEKGGIVTNYTAETGTAFGDRNGVTIEMQGISKAPMYQFNIS